MKAIPLLASGHYNWTAANAIQGGQVYFSSQDDRGRPLQPMAPPPRVLALAPTLSFPFIDLPNYQAMQAAMRRLATLAAISGRVPVWPTVECSASYAMGALRLHTNISKIDIPVAPFQVPDDWLAYYDASSRRVYCHRLSLNEPECLYEGAGMTVFEFEHLKQQLLLNHSGAHGEAKVQDRPAEGIDAIHFGMADGIRGKV